MMKLFTLLSVFFAFAAFADSPDEVEGPEERPIPEFKEMILLPKNEAAKDPSFEKFRKSFLTAIQKKNVRELLKHVDPKIKNSFGGEDGLTEFKKTWKLDKSAKSPLWAELGKVMNMGGSFMGKEFAAPYVYSEWPDEYEAFDFAAVVIEKAALRAEAKDGAATVRPLKREIVFVVNAGEDGALWQEIATFDKKRGWVKSSEIHSPVGYRAMFAKKNNAWKMTHFIAGD